MTDWPQDKLPFKGEPLTGAQMDLWNAEADVAVAEIEARVGPHPKTTEYQVWLEAKRAGSEAGAAQSGAGDR